MQSHASPGWLFLLSTARLDPAVDIALNDWLELPIDARAPTQSIAMVDVVGYHFTAVVVDTVAGAARWRIHEPRESIAQLYDGMLGPPGAPPRGTLIMSAPPIDSLDVPLQPGVAGAAPASGPDGSHAGGNCIVCPVVVPSPLPRSGPPGEPPDQLLVVLAQLHSQVARAVRVTIGNHGLEAALVRFG
ncbi:MAG TPA: hypothetical protein VHT91_45410 [Kofleriaceae bacterium]|nr:hypothetical protein [Kofleriaceae bacterium]